MPPENKVKQNFNTARHEALLNIARTAHCLAKISQQFFSRFAITEAQYNIMIIIKLEARELTQVEISERMVSSRANITSLIDKLEKKKYVERVLVEGDRRVYHISLTEEGRIKLEYVERKYLKAVESLMSSFSADESRLLSKLLVKARVNFCDVKRGEKNENE